MSMFPQGPIPGPGIQNTGTTGVKYWGNNSPQGPSPIPAQFPAHDNFNAATNAFGGGGFTSPPQRNMMATNFLQTQPSQFGVPKMSNGMATTNEGDGVPVIDGGGQGTVNPGQLGQGGSIGNGTGPIFPGFAPPTIIDPNPGGMPGQPGYVGGIPKPSPQNFGNPSEQVTFNGMQQAENDWQSQIQQFLASLFGGGGGPQQQGGPFGNNGPQNPYGNPYGGGGQQNPLMQFLASLFGGGGGGGGWDSGYYGPQNNYPQYMPQQQPQMDLATILGSLLGNGFPGMQTGPQQASPTPDRMPSLIDGGFVNQNQPNNTGTYSEVAPTMGTGLGGIADNFNAPAASPFSGGGGGGIMPWRDLTNVNYR